MSKEVFTIGHSNHTWEAFAALLKRHGVQVWWMYGAGPSAGMLPLQTGGGSLPSWTGKECAMFIWETL